jgi:hypothetical protein
VFANAARESISSVPTLPRSQPEIYTRPNTNRAHQPTEGVCVSRVHSCTDDAFARAFVCSSMGHTGRHANASSNRMNPLLLLYTILVTAIFALLNFPLSPSLPPIVFFVAVLVSPSTPLLLAHTSERRTSVRMSLRVLTILACLFPISLCTTDRISTRNEEQSSSTKCCCRSYLGLRERDGLIWRE